MPNVRPEYPGILEQTIPPAEHALITSKNARMWVWGVIKYEDVFDAPHATYFRYHVGYFELRDHTYGVSPEGNSAN